MHPTDTSRAAINLNIAPFGSYHYCRALAALAGVKLRKARVAAMAEPGRLSGGAADRITTALRRYYGVVPCGGITVGAALATFGAAVATGDAGDIGASLARAGYNRVATIGAASDGAAHGGLAAALGLPMPVVGGAALDPVALLAAVPPPRRMTRHPGAVALVVYLPRHASDAAVAWTTALLVACGGRYEVGPAAWELRWVPARAWPTDAPRWHVLAVRAHGAPPLPVDGVIRLE